MNLSAPIWEKTKEEIENKVMEHDKTENYLKGSLPKKIIIVPKRIINIVM